MCVCGSHAIWSCCRWDPVSVELGCDEACKWHLTMPGEAQEMRCVSAILHACSPVFVRVLCALLVTGIKWCFRVAPQLTGDNMKACTRGCLCFSCANLPCTSE